MLKITIQYFEGCPNWRLADDRLRQALHDVGSAGAEITYERIETPDQADKAGSRGSPSILAHGRDLFTTGDAPAGLACRVYQTESGPDGAPSLAQLAEALRRER